MLAEQASGSSHLQVDRDLSVVYSHRQGWKSASNSNTMIWFKMGFYLIINLQFNIIELCRCVDFSIARIIRDKLGSHHWVQPTFFGGDGVGSTKQSFYFSQTHIN